ncbi:M23 family metallopeptidase [Kamptonema cortianum]|nr:M23 family metallopeptidase [Kamptonema cortianum]
MKLKDIETTIHNADEAIEKPIKEAIAQLNADVSDIKETVDALFSNEQSKVRRATTLLLLKIFTVEIAWIFLIHPIGATAIANGNEFTQRIYEALNRTPLTLILPKPQKPEAKPQAQGWVNPLPGGRITSRFNPARKHPKTGKVQPHEGTDVSVGFGAPIVAAKSGMVTGVQLNCALGDLDCGGGYGNWIEVQHDDGYTTLYAHLQKIYVKPGQTVSAGDVIGTEGNTGRSTAAHLHFEIRKNGKPLDPEKVFPKGTWEDWR